MTNIAKVPYIRLDSGSTLATLDSPMACTLKGSRSFTERTFGPLTSGGIRQSIFTLISTSLGGGVLCLPFVMKQVGLVNGVLLLTLSGFIAFLTMYILMLCANQVHKSSYGSLLGHCVGSWVAPVLDIVMVLYGMGTLIAYFILLGDFLPALFSVVGLTSATRTVCMVGVAILAIPLVLPQRLSALQAVTPVATFSLVLTALITLIKAPSQVAVLPEETPFELALFGWPLLKCLTITMFAYICHMNVVPVASELVDASPGRAFKISSRVALIQLSFYLVIGISGYFSFSSMTNQNYITNYPSDDILINVCRLSLSISLFFSLPINTNPTAKAAAHFVESMREMIEDRNSDVLLPKRARAPSSQRIESAGQKALRIGCSLVILGITLIVGINVPGVADVVSVLGGSLGTLLMVTCPMVIFKVVFKDEAASKAGRAVVLLLATATVVAMSAVGIMVTNAAGMTAIPLTIG